MNILLRNWSLAFLYLFLSACSSLPSPMRNLPYTNIDFKEVKTNSASFQNKPFRWGGKIIAVTNEESSSQAQLLYYPLNRYGRLKTNKEAQGRFAITRTQLLDPAIYKEGTEVTVTGILTGEIKQKVGKKTLTLPLLKINHIHIWPKYQRIDDRFYYYPYSPYSAFPYYRHDFYYHGGF
ncbi:MAG: Slp family lipoprotein [Methylococcales bacterium]|nr:Slp family lipoprotein [Methylococcales bacterium]